MVDIILIVIVALYAFLGMKKGFIKSVVNFASTFISLIVTSFVYQPISDVLYKIGVGSITKGIVSSLLKEKGEEYLNETLLQQTAETASVIIVNAVSFIAVIIIVKILLTILIKSLNIIAKLPLIRQANSILGLIIGLISGILISYIVIGIIAALGENETISVINNSIESSKIAILLYEDNIITNLLTKILS